MKRALFPFTLVFISAILFSSCFSFTPTIRNNFSELPARDSAVVLFDNADNTVFLIKKCNGVDVNKSLYSLYEFLNNRNYRTEIIVPPGDNSFSFTFIFTYKRFLRSTIVIEVEDIELQYNLAAGNKYIVKARNVITKSGNRTLLEHYIGIYPDVRNSRPLREWKL
jgi:hypothetical protein